MRHFNSFLIPLIGLFAASCSLNKIETPAENSIVTFSIAAESTGVDDEGAVRNVDCLHPESKTWMDDQSTQVSWSRDDALNLLQIESSTYTSITSNEIIRTNDRYSAQFKFRVPAKPGTFGYWAHVVNKEQTGSHDDYWKGVNGASLSKYPMTIFTEQHPDESDYDPKCDILVSSSIDNSTQDQMVAKPHSFNLKRLNAFARVNLKGIPANHKVVKVVFESDMPIVGTKHYDVKNGTFINQREDLSTVITAVIDEKVQDIKYESGTVRRYHFSMWPCEIGHYDIEVTTIDPSNKTHKYGKNVDRSKNHLKFEASRMTQWGVTLSERTSSGEGEKVIEGNVDPCRTIELYRKLKSYSANGINYIDNWKTHKLGYQGVEIHEAKFSQYNKPVHMWIVEIDPTKASIIVGSANNATSVPLGKQTVQGQAELSKTAGKEVLAAINGDAWYDKNGYHYPYGVMWKDGVCMKSGATKVNEYGNQDVFYITDDGEFDIVNYYAFTNNDKGGGIVQNKKVQFAIGGWYRLICLGGDSAAQKGAKAGDPFIRDKSKADSKLLDFLNLNPRTFMGITEDRIYLMVVDGRREGWSVGLTLNGAARICYSLGCRRAINLDGGGSSTIIKTWNGGFQLLNMPVDGKQRPVVNTIQVIAK